MDLECTIFQAEQKTESYGSSYGASTTIITCVVDKIHCNYNNDSKITIHKKIRPELVKFYAKRDFVKYFKRMIFADLKLIHFPRGVGSLSKNLKQLVVVNCGIRSIDAQDFEGFRKLTDLNLSKNKITHLDKNVFAALANLSSLFLSSNQIAAIHEETFTTLPSLKFLDLTNNVCVDAMFDDFSKDRQRLRSEIKAVKLQPKSSYSGGETSNAVAQINDLNRRVETLETEMRSLNLFLEKKYE